MSIFVAIPTLVDNQTEDTIKDLIKKADNPNSIRIGLAYSTPKDYFDEHSALLKDIKQVECYFFNEEMNHGIGNGRKNALSMYAYEDYVLQIDSHTRFEKGWDTKLISMFEKAIKETKNERTILTAYLPMYGIDADGKRQLVNDNMPAYPFFAEGRIQESKYIPKWLYGKDYPQLIKNLAKNKFIPCVKFNANFVFGNRHFALSNSLPREILFMEEEIIQSINLIGNGFSLVFPNMPLPLAHLYMDNVDTEDQYHITYRHSVRTDYEQMDENYFRHIVSMEREKVIKFIEYSKVDPLSGTEKLFYIPKKFNH